MPKEVKNKTDFSNCYDLSNHLHIAKPMSTHKETNGTEEETIRLTINFSRSLLGKIDETRKAWGLRSRGATIERILHEIFEENSAQESIEEGIDKPKPPVNNPLKTFWRKALELRN